MRMYENGVYRDMTPEEIQEAKEWEEYSKERQKHEPPTASDLLDILFGGDTE